MCVVLPSPADASRDYDDGPPSADELPALAKLEPEDREVRSGTLPTQPLALGAGAMRWA